jgi:dipeptidyl aminopeptidase/acylaminoacyl peptidase
MMLKTIRFAPLLLLLALPMMAAEQHPFSIDDMLAMQRVSDAQLSPDGLWLLHGLRTTDVEANRGSSDLWLTATDGGGSKQLTTDPASEYNARWSPDGESIYFLSTRSGSSQVWRISLSGGEAQQVSELPLDVSSMAISPDGKMLAVSMDVFVDCETLACTVDRLAEQAAATTTGQVYDKLFVRHWDHWKDGRRSHLFVMPSAGGAAVNLMQGIEGDCPSKPFGGPEEYTFAPDSQGLVFAVRDGSEGEPWSTDFDLWHAPVKGKRRELTTDNPAWDTAPTFSPDGKSLAWLAMSRPGFEADRYRIRTMDWPSGKAKTLTETWDRSPGSISWSSDGSAIYVIAGHLGQRALFSIDPKSGKPTTIHAQGSIRSVGKVDGEWVVSMDHLNAPVELYRFKTGAQPQQISHFNDERVAAAAMGAPEQFTFKGWNDETVYGYVVKPANYRPGKKYPIAFLIHGGPQGSFGNSFHYRWNPQAYAGAGYASVMIDFHGSTGYGQSFTDSISGDWGGKPLEDLQKGLAAAIERYDWLDGEHVSALGASYGGYMINWIAGNWPDRFKALVNHDGILDDRSMYFETEELWFPEWERGGPPWEVPEAYEKHNPVHFVKNWKTPILIVHGALDYRVVDTQGLAAFTAAQRRGVPSRLLYFPDENHWVLKPQNSIQWHEVVLDWLDRWTKE